MLRFKWKSIDWLSENLSTKHVFERKVLFFYLRIFILSDIKMKAIKVTYYSNALSKLLELLNSKSCLSLKFPLVFLQIRKNKTEKMA